MVYAIFQISSRLSDFHGWLLVSVSGFDDCANPLLCLTTQGKPVPER